MKTLSTKSIAEQIEAQIDRSQWCTVKFSDLAENINEKITPKKSDLTHYIGLEHLDSGSLKIRRFGDPKAIKGDKLKIYKGDLIFAKRNAYLKRVSVAEFDAIASAHSMVLRAKPKTVLPEFLPFFMQSETFWERAIAISVGSLSPTINWKALAKQEFLLPPKDQQAKLAELLWAANAEVDALDELSNKLSIQKRSLQKQCFQLTKSNVVRLKQFTSVLSGYAVKSGDFVNQGLPVIKIKNISDGRITIDEKNNHLPYSYVDSKTKKYLVAEGDILIAMTGATLGKVGKVQKEFAGAFINQRVGKFVIRDSSFSDYIYAFLESPYFLSQVFKYIGEGAQGNVSPTDITQVFLPERDRDKCLLLSREFNEIEESFVKIQAVIAGAKSILKSLINQIF